MKYFEILYKNCFDKKYVSMSYAESEEEARKKFPTFNGCKLIDCKETTCENYRHNKIEHFLQYNFSVS